ncbi:hypothetical protein MKW98_013558 [Papaver atlanticum]|uniref:SS18 N-terminal domain-containing protein n=1 Tax=Papaver atlanticum TaxID=357466 RepID=A0AAD4SUN5_9MAGN|nr:hypothetical protein MKW98_013558 [Papaver atlanticum]
MQQQFAQMQPLMAAAYNPNNPTTEQIQQYLDENKSLIIKILENQTTGNVGELAVNQAKLEQNFSYLNAIAYSQPQEPTTHTQLHNGVQQGAHYMQHQQAHALTPQLSMAARSPMLYAQQPMFVTPQQQAMHGQLGMNSGMIHTEGRMIHGNYYGLRITERGMELGDGSMGFPDLSSVRLYRYDPNTSTLNKFWDHNKDPKCVSKDLGDTSNGTSLKDSGKATKANSGGTEKVQEKPVKSRGTKRKKKC